ncbi:MAG: tripartite tricarboxylate transporter substrate binding protein [Betaproteobacteria bacterium]|nr:tripartite tricarboxylate transporter substrate binding protein [Betaproteobacteria bacterium]MBI2290104.1 tripartite tricarboxylate transporter substrate binding protein [Betaproteobacteria bacterium]MBI3054874.1 tripartite tricarboxylate transporter substrate binding protein [Betaproteobacteria bacterium]
MTQISGLMFGLLALLIVGSPAAQTTYPEKPVRFVVGVPPGSQPDTVARLLGQKFAEAWGKPVVIDNVTGAAGNIAADRVAKAAPDGYTLGLLGQAQIVINPSLYKLAYDPVKDFAPVSQVAMSPNMLVVHNAVPAKNVQELIKLARARPGELTFASGGSGSALHIAGELLKSVAGLDIRHIPYKGGVAAIPDLLGGRVTMMFGTTVVVLPLALEGKLRALAVTSLKRSSAAPELPTIAESGYPGFEVTSWYGLLAPARTPATIVGKLHLETVKALALPDLRAKLADLGLEGIGNSPDEFAAVIKSEIPKWAKVIKESGMKPE